MEPYMDLPPLSLIPPITRPDNELKMKEHKVSQPREKGVYKVHPIVSRSMAMHRGKAGLQGLPTSDK
jgi:hypothetical protein